MISQLLYIALGFGSGLIVAAAVGTLALLRWAGKPEPDAGEAEAPPEVSREAADDLPTGAVGMSGYRLNQVVLDSLHELPVVVSMTEKEKATGEETALPHYNVRMFLTNYETVRKENVSSAAEEYVPSAADLEKLFAVAHGKNISD